MKLDKPAFHCTYSTSIPKLLLELNCSILIASKQAGKIISISPENENRLIQLPRDFRQVTSISAMANQLVIATRDEVSVLTNCPGMAPNYPGKPNVYDSLYIPRQSFNTGHIDLNDIFIDEDNIVAAVTSMSCIALINNRHSIQPIWQPDFIGELSPEDKCHLTGVAMVDSKPKYVSVFSDTNTPFGWRSVADDQGAILEMESNNKVAANLSKPNTPRVYDNELYIIESGKKQLLQINPSNGDKELVCRLKGYGRGMSKWGDYLFVGLSSIRTEIATGRANYTGGICGIEVVHMPTGVSIGNIQYHKDLFEINDVEILHNSLRPNILNRSIDLTSRIITTPETNFLMG